MSPAQCDACSKKFSWLKKKRTCAMCGSLCCSDCMQRARYCAVGRYCLRCVRLGGLQYERSALMQMPVRDLKHIMKIMNVSAATCREKSELVERILQREGSFAPSAPPLPPRAASPPLARQQPRRHNPNDSIRVGPYQSIRVRPIRDPPPDHPDPVQSDYDTKPGEPASSATNEPPAPSTGPAPSAQDTASGAAGEGSPAVFRTSERRLSEDDSDDDDVGEFIVVDDERARTESCSDHGAQTRENGDARPTSADESVVIVDDAVLISDDESVLVLAPDSAESVAVSEEEPLGVGGGDAAMDESVARTGRPRSVAGDAGADVEGVGLEESVVMVDGMETGNDGSADDQEIVVDDIENETACVPTTPEMTPVEEMEKGETLLVEEFDLSSVTDVGQLPSEECIHRLTVRQCKQMLQRRRTEFRDVIEKEELVRRVRQLWHETKKNAADLETATERDICKICMDALVDCVMLECGHMATCTACGKQMSECPICRQYVVRVVHVFRS